MKKSASLRFALLIAIILVSSLSTLADDDTLRAGCARIDITPTPPIGVWLSGYGHRNKPSDGICDPLYAKALILDDGQTKVALVSVDLLWVFLEMTTQVRNTINVKTGIPQQNILICATHTHFGPKIDRPTKNWPDAADSKIDTKYVQKLQDKLLEVILKANNDLTPARLGTAAAEVPEVVYNRRTKKADGSVVMTFRLPRPEPGLTFGPVDSRLSILKIEDPMGKLLTTLVNFACHPVSGAKETETFYSISADYPAYVAQTVENVEGGLCLFALGTAGNMNPNRLNRTNPRTKIGRALGAETLRQIQFTPTSGNLKLSAMTKSVTLPLKQDLPADRVVDGNEKRTALTTEIQAVRIGETYILGLPGEILVEIGMEIRKKTGLDNLFIISLANDGCGYVCPRQAYKEGAYEPGQGTDLAEGAGEIITEQAIDLLGRIRQSG